MPLDRRDIERLVPHAGAMVLLDRVLDWNQGGATCETEAHRRRDNPLRRGDMLAAVAGVEIAAQAMAVHGHLTGDGSLRQGRLASLRDLQLYCRRLDDVPAPIAVRVKLLGGGREACMYSFRLDAGVQALISGRAGVFFR